MKRALDNSPRSRLHDVSSSEPGPIFQRVEWPTIVVAVAIGGGFTSVAIVHERLPTVVVIVLLGLLGAWYGSLQHEVVHGHPTPWRWMNTTLVALPLGLTEPFWHYRAAHLQHHATDDLTSPRNDPESHYLDRSDWAGRRPFVQQLRRANMTLAGRLVIGPWLAGAVVARRLVVEWSVRPWRVVRFAIADLSVVAVVVWIGVPVWQYLAGVVYLGTSLTMIRSFAEHRAVPCGSRTAVVCGRGPLALLFLNNNLHVTHHRLPGLAWYELPVACAQSDDADVAAAGAGLYAGYRDIFSRYLFRAIAPVVDPLTRSPAEMQR